VLLFLVHESQTHKKYGVTDALRHCAGHAICVASGTAIVPSTNILSRTLYSNIRDGLVAGGDDAGVFYHQDYGALRGPSAVQDTFGDNEALAGVERDHAILQIN
jgi:hypothetical protein